MSICVCVRSCARVYVCVRARMCACVSVPANTDSSFTPNIDRQHLPRQIAPIIYLHRHSHTLLISRTPLECASPFVSVDIKYTINDRGGW